MRLGGPVYGATGEADSWITALRQEGYRAAYWPLDESAGEAKEQEFVRAAREADIVIAEVGAWSNPISPDEATRQKAMAFCRERLALAERVGARCCVNIAGARNPTQWDGPHPENLSEETFDLIVETVRAIIDAVKPTRTFYTLEPMPWVFPDSPENYLRLLQAIDRPQFGVHLDPVNMISSPQRLFQNADFLRECFRLLGPYIQSVHAKDSVLTGKLTAHLDEVIPGRGQLDYSVFLTEMTKLGEDTPFLLEHLASEAEYHEAAAYVRSVAAGIGLKL